MAPEYSRRVVVPVARWQCRCLTEMESLEAAHAAEVDPEESQPTTVEISDEKYANMDEFAMPYKVRGPPQEIITCPLL